MVIWHSSRKNAGKLLTHIAVKLSGVIIAVQLTGFLQRQVDTHVALAIKVLLIIRRNIEQRITFPSAV